MFRGAVFSGHGVGYSNLAALHRLQSAYSEHGDFQPIYWIISQTV